jgi:hypothetical protein
MSEKQKSMSVSESIIGCPILCLPAPSSTSPFSLSLLHDPKNSIGPINLVDYAIDFSKRLKSLTEKQPVEENIAANTLYSML